MRTLLSAVVCVVACVAAAPAVAELIAVDGKPVVRSDSLPKPSRGMSMQSVEAQFGAPAQKRSAVGQPPITRWDYPGFAVYFEHERVLHAVTGAG